MLVGVTQKTFYSFRIHSSRVCSPLQHRSLAFKYYVKKNTVVLNLIENAFKFEFK